MMREQARVIGTQHNYWKTHEPTKTRIPVTFENWFILVMRKQEKKGIEFEFVCPGLVKIITPGKPAILRTVEDFRREFNTLYPTAEGVRQVTA